MIGRADSRLGTNNRATGRRPLLPVAFVAASLLAVVPLACDKVESATPPTEVPLVAEGMRAAVRQGCIACHSDDGSITFGPSWKGLYGSTLKFTDGTSAVADEKYLRESIKEPTAKIIEGWQISMPSFLPASEAEITAIIAYIKSLR